MIASPPAVVICISRTDRDEIRGRKRTKEERPEEEETSGSGKSSKGREHLFGVF